MKNTGRPAALLSSAGPKLQYIIEKVSHLATLNEALQKVIPSPLSEHCRVANLKDNCLIIEADSAVWATPLRFQLPFILQKLRPLVGLYGVQHINYFIRQPTHTLNSAKNNLSKAHLSLSSADIIKETALSISYLPLQQAFLNIARHGKAL